MRTIRIAPVLAAVALLAGCSNPVQPSSQRQIPESVAPASTVGDSTAVSRGSGYFGTGA